MAAISSLLVDLDGTLLDTEPLHIEAHRRFLGKHGIEPTDADLLGNIGKGDVAFYETLIARHGKRANAETWVAEKTSILIELYRTRGVPTRPGVHEFLAHAFGQGLPCVVVTSSERAVAQVALNAAALATRLPMRVCYEDTVLHKPNPDPYLLAASRLGVPPAMCLAIEDSTSGVTSACAAGAQVVAIQGHLPAADLRRAGAARVVDRLDELVPVRALTFEARIAAAR